MRDAFPKPGNGNIVSFSGNEFKQYFDGQVVETYNYTILDEITNRNNENIRFQIVSDKKTIPFKVTQNTLVLHKGHLASDGVILTYERISGIPK